MSHLSSGVVYVAKFNPWQAHVIVVDACASRAGRMNDAPNFSLTDCDVPLERRSALEAYRAKRRTWLEWIDNDDDHAICTTLSAMIWNDVSFRTLGHLGASDAASPLGNSLVAEKLINGALPVDKDAKAALVIRPGR